jgi:hypothetical protein
MELLRWQIFQQCQGKILSALDKRQALMALSTTMYNRQVLPLLRQYLPMM